LFKVLFKWWIEGRAAMATASIALLHLGQKIRNDIEQGA